MALNLSEVMDGIADALAEIDGLRAYGYPVDSATPPFAVVGYPEPTDFDLAYGSTGDEITFPVWVGVGAVYGKASRDLLSVYTTRGHAKSVQEALEADPTLGGAVEDSKVSSVQISFVELGGNIYLAAEFSVSVLI